MLWVFKKKPTPQKTGKAAETRAKTYLLGQGLICLYENYHCRFGEIDLIMQDKDCLVFVEVRARSSMAFGGALASITAAKQAKLIKTARYFLCCHRQYTTMPARFDALTLQGESFEIEWIKHIFYAL